jgi:hypothetical protein
MVLSTYDEGPDLVLSLQVSDGAERRRSLHAAFQRKRRAQRLPAPPCSKSSMLFRNWYENWSAEQNFA